MRVVCRFLTWMLAFLFMASICSYPAEAAPIQPKDAAGAGTAQQPDLVISRISVNNARIVFGTRDSRVTFTVKNQGQAPVQGDIRCQVVGRTGYMTIPGGLAAGQEKQYSFLVGHDNGWPVGTYRIRVKVDYQNAINESNENNNESQEVSFEVVNPARMATLRAATEYTDTHEPFAGGHITVTIAATGQEVGRADTPCQFNLPANVMYRVTCVIHQADFERLQLVNQIERQGPRDVFLEEKGWTEIFFYGRRR